MNNLEVMAHDECPKDDCTFFHYTDEDIFVYGYKVGFARAVKLLAEPKELMEIYLQNNTQE